MKKHILVMSFGSDAGGIEKSLIEFLRFLVSEGHQIDLYLWKAPGILYSKIPQEVNIIHTKLYPGSFWEIKTAPNPFLFIIWYLRFKIATYYHHPTSTFRQFGIKYDIAISYCQNGYSPYYIIDKVQADKKYIWYHHGSYEAKKSQKKLDEKYYSKYDKFITVSVANKLMLEKNFPQLRNKILVINNLSNDIEIRELAKGQFDIPWGNGIKLTTVGRIAPEKGQILAIEAAKLLKERGINFTWYFVGNGPDMTLCCKKIKDYELTNLCILSGAKENPYPYIYQADLYVQTSYIEADPITIREAKILKKVIIASRIPANEEALDNGRLGCLVDLTPNAIANAIIQLSRHKEEKQKYESAISYSESDKIQILNNIRMLLK